jgi:hypothetical protein
MLGDSEGFPGGGCRGTFPCVQASPSRQGRWWISPAIPTIANMTLAALWGFSAFGGWGEAAFCADDAKRPNCVDSVDFVIGVSAVPAVLAVVVALGSWALPGVRRNADRLDDLLSVAALCWIAAEAILFVGGYLAKP